MKIKDIREFLEFVSSTSNYLIGQLDAEIDMQKIARSEIYLLPPKNKGVQNEK